MSKTHIQYQLADHTVDVRLTDSQLELLESAREHTGLDHTEFLEQSTKWRKEHNPELKQNVLQNAHRTKAPGRGSAMAENAKNRLIKKQLLAYSEFVVSNDE